jgi:hypothetical protein
MSLKNIKIQNTVNVHLFQLLLVSQVVLLEVPSSQVLEVVLSSSLHLVMLVAILHV